VLDASGSVSTERCELQRKGYVAAFRDKQVLDARCFRRHCERSEAIQSPAACEGSAGCCAPSVAKRLRH
jgi:hypothetical protein